MYDKKKSDERMQEVYRSRRWKGREIRLKAFATVGVTLLWAVLLVDRLDSIPPGSLRVLTFISLPISIIIARIAVSVIIDILKNK